jgi:hypothetical protein
MLVGGKLVKKFAGQFFALATVSWWSRSCAMVAEGVDGGGNSNSNNDP